MPKVTTLEYDRAEVEQLALRATAKQTNWDGAVVGTVKSDGVVLRRSGTVSRETLAEIVEATPDANGQKAEVVVLTGQGMKVELTAKGEEKKAEEDEGEEPEPEDDVTRLL